MASRNDHYSIVPMRAILLFTVSNGKEKIETSFLCFCNGNDVKDTVIILPL
jgi:hypothetical protein